MVSCDASLVTAMVAGKRVAVVGSGPGVLDNEPGFIDSHEVVVRVNQYKLSEAAGFRCDIHYSFYGGSIKNTAESLKAHGVKLCMCKCPDEGPIIDSPWHRKMGKPHGVDFRYIYKDRADWWFCPTYVPPKEEFLEVFNMLEQHIPSTGFSALLAIRSHAPESIYATGFDFFASRVHNVNEPWRPGNPEDPIGHAPELERAWLKANRDGITVDKRLAEILET